MYPEVRACRSEKRKRSAKARIRSAITMDSVGHGISFVRCLKLRLKRFSLSYHDKSFQTFTNPDGNRMSLLSFVR
jgi:hypothetical protein